MVSNMELAVKLLVNLPGIPEHWDNFFYEYYNLREKGYSRGKAKEQAMKMTMWKYKKRQ